MKTKKLLLMFIVVSLFMRGNAQTTPPDGQAPPGSATPQQQISTKGQAKGHFFLTPFYQYTRFEKMKLTSHTTTYSSDSGAYAYPMSDHNVNEYNDNYGTQYTNHIAGLRVGYLVMNGLGISASVGIDNFNFQSWISDEHKQTHSSKYPGILLGLAVDYQLKITNRLAAMALGSYTYSHSSSVSIDDGSAGDVVSSKVTAMYWDVNLSLAYRLGRFVPYAGIGFTQQFVHPVTNGEIITADENENPYLLKIQYDSHFSGNSLYGFAGADFFFSDKLSVFVRSSFANPLRASTGFRIIL